MNQTDAIAPGAAPSRRARLQLLLVALLFFGSLGAGFLLYYGLDWRPADTSNHGTLISPAHPLEPFSAPRLGGGAIQPKTLADHWNLVYVAGGACEAACQQELYKLRQVRLTFGKDAPRLQRLLLLDGPLPQTAPDWLARHPDLLVGGATGNGLAGQIAAAAGVPAQGRLFIVDPLGNLMMRYEGDFTMKGLQEDLKRLLKYSHIG